jgi:uncharacterized surface protein with fasciclin (FAS1) repeats
MKQLYSANARKQINQNGGDFLRKSVIISLLILVASVSPILAAMAAPPGPTIVDVAVAVNNEGPYAGAFDTLIAAVTATPNVASILNGNGQHTVFAPTDDAFEALAEELEFGGVSDLVIYLINNPEVLESVLLYHIAHGRLYAEDVLPKDRINTLILGREGFLMQDSGVLTDNNDRTANIIVTDVEAANGIIHVIDAVVLP